MPFDAKYQGNDTGTDFPAVWVIPAALRQLAECGDAELVEELIAIFQTDTAERLEVMRQAVSAKDYSVVNAEAHTIKGSSVQVGANRLADFCHQMEQEARKSPSADLTQAFDRLVSAFDEVCLVIAARKPQQ
jgi:HPt (histidine-containing phosphotransfer) domain-containing protein